MNAIKFKGYNRKSKKWLEGYYVKSNGKHYICPEGKSGLDKYEVDPNSIGQFTGVYDENRREVYTGDVVSINGKEGTYGVLMYESAYSYASIEQYADLAEGRHPFFNDYALLPCIGDFEIQGLIRVVGNVYNKKLLS